MTPDAEFTIDETLGAFTHLDFRDDPDEFHPLARVRPDVRSMLAVDGVETRRGALRFHSNLDEAVDAAIAWLGEEAKHHEPG